MDGDIKLCPKCGSELISHDIFRNFKMIKNYRCLKCNWPKNEEDLKERFRLKLGQ